MSQAGWKLLASGGFALLENSTAASPPPITTRSKEKESIYTKIFPFKIKVFSKLYKMKVTGLDQIFKLKHDSQKNCQRRSQPSIAKRERR